jgi:hypothetical protein
MKNIAHFWKKVAKTIAKPKHDKTFTPRLKFKVQSIKSSDF